MTIDEEIREYKRECRKSFNDNHIRFNKDLSDAAKLLAIEISCIDYINFQCDKTNEFFCELLGWSIRTVQRCLQELEDKGFIKREYEKKGKHNIRFITLIKDSLEDLC